jgi:hypothetical protein
MPRTEPTDATAVVAASVPYTFCTCTCRSDGPVARTPRASACACARVGDERRYSLRGFTFLLHARTPGCARLAYSTAYGATAQKGLGAARLPGGTYHCAGRGHQVGHTTGPGEATRGDTPLRRARASQLCAAPPTAPARVRGRVCASVCARACVRERVCASVCAHSASILHRNVCALRWRRRLQHAQTHARTHTHSCTQIHARTHTHTHANTHLQIHTHAQTIHLHLRTHIYT